MLCPKCHKVAVPGGKFCGSCGADLSGKSSPAGKVRPVQTLSIGRSSECDVTFSDRSVSRKHCSVEKLSDGTFFLRDLHSKNGTFVDGIQIRQKHITASSRIRLGNLSMSGADLLARFSDRAAAASVKPSADMRIFYITGGIAAALLLLFFVFPLKNIDTAQNQPPESVSPPQSAAVMDWMRDVEKATVIIGVQLRNGDYALGSGFFVNERTIVTNRHVVTDARRINIGNKIIGNHSARIIAIAQGRQEDFAALDVGKDIAAPLPLATMVSRNDKVYAWGYPGILVGAINWSGLPEVVSTSGEVNVIRNGATNLIVHSAKISQGNSGGPLINENGCVVGINTMFIGDKTGQYYISYASSDIINFLNAYGIRYNKR